MQSYQQAPQSSAPSNGIVTRNPQTAISDPMPNTATNMQGNTQTQVSTLQGFLVKGAPGTTVTLPAGISPQTIALTEVDVTPKPTSTTSYITAAVTIVVVGVILLLVYRRFIK